MELMLSPSGPGTVMKLSKLFSDQCAQYATGGDVSSSPAKPVVSLNKFRWHCQFCYNAATITEAHCVSK